MNTSQSSYMYTITIAHMYTLVVYKIRHSRKQEHVDTSYCLCNNMMWRLLHVLFEKSKMFGSMFTLNDYKVHDSQYIVQVESGVELQQILTVWQVMCHRQEADFQCCLFCKN